MSGRDDLVERIAFLLDGDIVVGCCIISRSEAREIATAILPIIDAEIAAGERDMKNRAIQCCAAANGQDNIDNGAAMTGAAGMARQLIERLTIRSQL